MKTLFIVFCLACSSVHAASEFVLSVTNATAAGKFVWVSGPDVPFALPPFTEREMRITGAGDYGGSINVEAFTDGSMATSVGYADVAYAGTNTRIVVVIAGVGDVWGFGETAVRLSPAHEATVTECAEVFAYGFFTGLAWELFGFIITLVRKLRVGTGMD